MQESISNTLGRQRTRGESDKSPWSWPIKPLVQIGRWNRKSMYLFSIGNVYKDAVCVDLSHRGRASPRIACWSVNQQRGQQLGRDLLHLPPPPLGAHWPGGAVRCPFLNQGFSRGWRVGLQPWNTLVLSSSSYEMPANAPWISPKQTQRAHKRDESLGSATLLSIDSFSPFFDWF